MKQLEISATFLSGMYHGKEWPPAPMRLFQAIIAGHNQGRARRIEDAKFGAAMRWLECLPPPSIFACEAISGSTCRRSVPNNDDDIAMSRAVQSRPETPYEKAKRYAFKATSPWFLEGDHMVHYSWEVPEGNESFAEDVKKYASEITILGWGVDMVSSSGAVLASATPRSTVRFTPHSNAGKGRVLRVPCEGSYQSAEVRYSDFISSGWREGGLTFTKTPLKYFQVGYIRDDEQPDQHYQCYHLLEVDGRSSYVRDPREGIAVAAMLRHAINGLLQREGYDDQTIQELLGHGQKGRQVSCLPLPSVGHRHADGMIRRVMLKSSDSSVLSRLNWGLEGCELKYREQPVAMLSPIHASDGVVDRFTSESMVWETVTPVILPGYDQIKKRKRRTEKLIGRSLLQSGITPSQVASIWYRKLPWNHHGYPAGAYQTARYMRYPQYHVKVEFRKAVRGPLALGAGRYFGLGLMVGLEEKRLTVAA